MPLKKCSSGGKSGWKWGDQGHCYTGPGGKKADIRQGIAIEGTDKFKKIQESEGSIEDIKEVLSDPTTSDEDFNEIANAMKLPMSDKVILNVQRMFKEQK